MKVIGIVGGIGSGKTTVVSLIKECATTYVISADQIGHDILKKGHKAYEEVVRHFGTTILGEDSEIIRKRLGDIVFGDPVQLQKLNSISHPLIYEEVKREIDRCKQEHQYTLIIIDAALLIEIGLIHLTDLVIAVNAEEETRVVRLMVREGFTREQIIDRFKVQKKWEELSKVAHIIIDNNVSLDYTREQIKDLIVHL